MTEPDSEVPACSPEAGLRCWLLDTAGHVVYASGDLPPLRNGSDAPGGPHLGLSDPELMAALVNATVYRQTTEYDYQGQYRVRLPGSIPSTTTRFNIEYDYQGQYRVQLPGSVPNMTTRVSTEYD